MKNKSSLNLAIWALELMLIILMVPACVSCNKDSNKLCPDPFSVNYSATDGSLVQCRYDGFERNPHMISNLDQKIKETSGLASIDGHLITHNDNGNKNELYAFDLEGAVTHTFTVEGAQNIDWEDLAQSEDHLYILDAGNNDGDRQNLRVFKVRKSEFNFDNASSFVQVEEVIRFYYPEQLNFEKQAKHNFDCEALIYRDETLYLFTKHRLDGQTVSYKLPSVEGNYPAEKISSFQAGVKITGADIRSDGLEVCLIGYNKKQECILWKLSGYEQEDIFSGRKVSIVLGPYVAMGQMESVLYQPEVHDVYITSERVKEIPARLYEIGVD